MIEGELNEGDIVQADMQAVKEQLAKAKWDEYDEDIHYRIDEIEEDGDLIMQSLNADLQHRQMFNVDAVKRLYNKVGED